MRNAIAHGTFNILSENKAIFVGQSKSKQESSINFYLQLASLSLIEELYADFKKLARLSASEFLAITYRRFFPYRESDKPGLFKMDKSFLYFDVDFEFESVADSGENNNQDIQILNYLDRLADRFELESLTPITIILNANSTSLFHNTKKKYPNANIITPNGFLNHLGVK